MFPHFPGPIFFRFEFGADDGRPECFGEPLPRESALNWLWPGGLELRLGESARGVYPLLPVYEKEWFPYPPQPLYFPPPGLPADAPLSSKPYPSRVQPPLRGFPDGVGERILK